MAAVMIITTGCTKAARKERALERANKSFQAQQFDKAEIEYMNALRLAPGDPVSIRQLGLIYSAEGRVAAAFRFLHKANELEPENADVQQKLALAYLTVGKRKEARELALKLLPQRPGDTEILQLVAETSGTPKEIEESRKLISQAQKKNQDAAGYHLAFGTLFLHEKDLAGAEREFNTAFKLDPKSASANIALGNFALSRNELDKAEAYFKAAAQFAPARSPHPLKYAAFLLKIGKIDDAKKLLKEITEKTPDYIPAWTSLMEIALAQKKLDECDDLVKKVLARDPENYDALLFSANLKMLNGDAAKAISELERMQTAFGETPKVLYQLALASVSNGDVNKAVRSLERAITLNPGFTQAALVLSELQIRQGNATAAIPRLVKITKAEPKLVQAQLLLASAYTSQKNLSDAEAIYRQLGTLFPKDPQAPLFLGLNLSQQHKTSEARKAFENALSIAPKYLAAVDQLVSLDLAEKKFDDAEGRVQEQIKKSPDAAEPWLLLAKVQLAQDKKNDAEASLKKSISLNPDARLAYMLLAQLYVDSNRQQDALANLNTIAQKTNDVSVLMQMGMIHDQLKDFTAARDAYEKILTINPRFSPALNNLAYIYSEHLNQLDKAYEMAQKARQLLPYDPYTADTLGWILYKRGDYSRALGLIQESSGKLIMQPEVEFHLGMTYYMLGQEKQARTALDNALHSTNSFSGKDLIQPALAILDIDEQTASASAIPILEKCIKEEPRDLAALSRLASIYERNGDFEKAVTVCESALKNTPGNARLSARLARLYESGLKNPQKAFEYAKEAHSNAPNDPAISHLLGRLSYETGDFKWSLSLLQEAALKLPKDPEVLRDLAWASYSQGQVTEAETTMQSALAAASTSVQRDQANTFLAMLKAGRDPVLAAKSSAQAQKILQTNPNHLPALMSLALSLEQKGDYAAARDGYEKILARFPLFTPATRQLAFLYANHLNDDTKAYDLALKARSAFPDDKSLTKLSGMLAYRKGDYAKSAQYLKEIARSQQNDADSMFYLGMAQYRLKDLKASKASLQSALKLNLPGNLAAEAQKVLSELK